MKRLFYFPFLLILYEFVLIFSNDMYTPALPSLVGYMKADYTVIQLTVCTWLAGMAVIALFLCPMYERYGRRRVFLGGGIAFVFATLLCSAAHSISFLAIVRFLQGASICSFLIGGYGQIHELYEHETALKIIKRIISVLILSPMIGPFLGGLMLIVSNWRVIFGALFALGILFLIPLWLSMPSQEAKPLVKRIMCAYHLRSKKFFVGGVALGLIYGAFFIWITASPFLVIGLLKYQPYQFGLAQIPIFGSFLIGYYLFNSVTRQMKRHRIIHIGLFIAFLSVVGMLLWNLYTEENLLSLILPMSGIGFGFGLAIEQLYQLTLHYAYHGRKDGKVAALFFVMTGTAALGTLLISLVSETFLSVIGMLTIFVSLACLCEFGFETLGESSDTPNS